MGDFLTAAEQLLKEIGKPLSTHELARLCIEKKLLSSEGRTPPNTMRARLSEELRKHGATSNFQRVGKNRFALREWKLKEYIAPQFTKDVSIENVVCLDSRNLIFKNNEINGIFSISESLKNVLFNRDNLTVFKRELAEKNTNYKQLIAYVMLKSKDGKILTYIRGKYSSAHKTLLRGRHSLGFGGHVLDEDIYDLFSIKDAGVINAAIREVSEELKGFQPLDCNIISVIHDSTSSEGYKHMAVVIESFLPENFNYSKYKKELSINGIQLQTPGELWSSFHLFEYWSQLIIKDRFIAYRPKHISTIYPSKPPKNSKTIILVGEIASGKTSILQTLSSKFGYHYISARQCLVEILNIPDFENRNRTEFQEKAQRLITDKNGPNILAKKIFDKVENKTISLIDGIRNVSTIKELKSILGDCTIVYIDCPRDKALLNFTSRSKEENASVAFVNAREHPTELELPLILEEADAILYNADSLDVTIEIFSNWLNKNTHNDSL